MDSNYKYRNKPFEEMTVQDLKVVHAASKVLIARLIDQTQQI